jgi:hypothetical protein
MNTVRLTPSRIEWARRLVALSFSRPIKTGYVRLSSSSCQREMKPESQIDSYLRTAAGKFARYRLRRRKRILILIDDVEPRSKKMPAAAKIDFQRQVAELLADTGRSAFRGKIALRLRLATTHKTPPQVHSIVKNLLDLLGKQGPGDTSWQKTRLYKDDSQIHALSVSCVHGETRPSMTIVARSLASMTDDVELAAEATRTLAEDDPDEPHRAEGDQEWIASFKRLIQGELQARARSGDELYEAMVKGQRGYAQRAFLGQSAISIPVLGWLYGRPKGPFMQPLLDPWPTVIRQTGLRIQLGELPARTGDSSLFKQRIDAALADFEQRWGWLVRPLVVPVGLQVIVQPNPSTPPGTQHDLDNIVRDYLLPKMVAKFSTVSAHVWTVDFEELARVAPDLARRWGAEPKPPKGTRDGVTGYEVWQLPPAPAGEPGFVSVAMTAQPDFEGDLMERADLKIKRWAEHLEENSESPRRFSRLW